MTKEELEKEAYEYFKSICDDYNEELERTGKRHYWVGFDIENAYIASAEPREKQITRLSKHILELQKDKGNLIDRCRELEAQIEKMKCCYNCKHSRTEYEHCKTDKSEKWEMKENGNG
jgi:hypothetical protein